MVIYLLNLVCFFSIGSLYSLERQSNKYSHVTSADRPDDAQNFSQAGGSSRLEDAGVWWCSMPFETRITYTDFVENSALIEGNWDKNYEIGRAHV